jgi:hypothetical protein
MLRTCVLVSGAVAGVLMVHALDEGLGRRAIALGAGHVAAGLTLAVAVMPGPLLGAFVSPASSDKARGLAFGGSAVTAFTATLGGALLLTRWGRDGATLETGISLGWCALALPLAALDAWRVRLGAGDPDAPPGESP